MESQTGKAWCSRNVGMAGRSPRGAYSGWPTTRPRAGPISSSSRSIPGCRRPQSYRDIVPPVGRGSDGPGGTGPQRGAVVGVGVVGSAVGQAAHDRAVVVGGRGAVAQSGPRVRGGRGGG